MDSVHVRYYGAITKPIPCEVCALPAHKLILLPTDPDTGIENCEQLVHPLQAIGFIGEPASCRQGLFYPVGDRFLQLVSFLGCSPMIELDPPANSAELDAAIADGRFCHVMLTCSPALQFRADPQTRPPRCPQCGHADTHWAQRLQDWRDNPAETGWTCAACEQPAPLTSWVFRKTAGFGKVFVEIRGIYPSEAVPGDLLLNTLRSVTGNAWHYIYIKE